VILLVFSLAKSPGTLNGQERNLCDVFCLCTAVRKSCFRTHCICTSCRAIHHWQFVFSQGVKLLNYTSILSESQRKIPQLGLHSMTSLKKTIRTKSRIGYKLGACTKLALIQTSGASGIFSLLRWWVPM